MKPQYAVWTACAVLALACGATADEQVKLEYKLKPGMELVYKTTGTIKTVRDDVEQVQGETSGTVRCVVGEVDEKTGVALLGQSSAIKTVRKMEDGAASRESTRDEVSICRMNRAGKPVVRKTNEDAMPRPAVAAVSRLLDRRQVDMPPLPGDAVAVGAKWESVLNSGLQGNSIPLAAKVASTLVEIKTVDGRRCAVIKSKLSPSDQNPAQGPGRYEVTGEMETLFDVEGGFARSVTSKLSVNVAFNGGQNVSSFATETTNSLDSSKTLPAVEAARETKLIKALDAALDNIYAGDTDKALDTLNGLNLDEMPEAWKTGVKRAISRVNASVRAAQGQFGPGQGAVQPTNDPAQRLFSSAQSAMRAERWADAVAKFKEFADKYPDDEMAVTGLMSAATICETHLNDANSAAEFRRRAAALKEKR